MVSATLNFFSNSCLPCQITGDSKNGKAVSARSSASPGQVFKVWKTIDWRGPKMTGRYRRIQRKLTGWREIGWSDTKETDHFDCRQETTGHCRQQQFIPSWEAKEKEPLFCSWRNEKLYRNQQHLTQVADSSKDVSHCFFWERPQSQLMQITVVQQWEQSCRAEGAGTPL